jgi:hypothetical protein
MGSKKNGTRCWGLETILGLEAVTWQMTWHGISFAWKLLFFKIPNSTKVVEFQILLEVVEFRIPNSTQNKTPLRLLDSKDPTRFLIE